MSARAADPFLIRASLEDFPKLTKYLHYILLIFISTNHPRVKRIPYQYSVSYHIATLSARLQHIPSSVHRSMPYAHMSARAADPFLIRAESRKYPKADKIPTLHTLDLHQHKSAQSQTYSIPVFSQLAHIHPLCQPTAHPLKCPSLDAIRTHERKSCRSISDSSRVSKILTLKVPLH